jgi:hypothetical protein
MVTDVARSSIRLVVRADQLRVLDSEPYVFVSLDTLIIVGALMVAGMYLAAQAVIGVNFARLSEARRIAAESLRGGSAVHALPEEEQERAARERAAIDHLIAYRPSTREELFHTGRRGSL